MFTELAGQVGRELGEEDAVIVFDPSAFAKKGKQSVGVARQWSGRQGKVDNAQVAVYIARPECRNQRRSILWAALGKGLGIEGQG